MEIVCAVLLFAGGGASVAGVALCGHGKAGARNMAKLAFAISFAMLIAVGIISNHSH